jgi:2-polyprenyl-3-methyl-5-hydroxy-6-metoxy-1,4-benzoquinol methylase
MDHFVKPVDSLSKLIDEKATELYHKLADLPVTELGFPEMALSYYQSHHHERLFFSVQTAAELLYRSILMKNKPLEELIIMDYGAGVGSLYLLAKMIGCKMAIYNDIVEDLTKASKITGDFLNIDVDLYITADHRGTIEQLNQKGISCDIIVSRNVVEHIYDLGNFYRDMAKGQPDALLYFSTTANYQNPAMLWYHKKMHKAYEQEYRPKREKIIHNIMPALTGSELDKVTTATRGLAAEDLVMAVKQYQEKGTLPDPSIFYTNTCAPETGIWAENILPIQDYQKIIETKGYKLSILPAFWDTHYSSGIKNIFAKTMNVITRMLGDKGGLRTTAFIYIIAEKK